MMIDTKPFAGPDPVVATHDYNPHSWIRARDRTIGIPEEAADRYHSAED